jgi:hypothetical protein
MAARRKRNRGAPPREGFEALACAAFLIGILVFVLAWPWLLKIAGRAGQ